MAHLLQRHDFAEAGLIGLRRRRLFGLLAVSCAFAANAANTDAAITAATIGFIALLLSS